MAVVFQYGSNMSVKRLNTSDRLDGDAKPIGVATTVGLYELVFTVWSKTNGCAAADIIPCQTGRSIYGILYSVPDYLLPRDAAKAIGRKSRYTIEGQGGNYDRKGIEIVTSSGEKLIALTYVARDCRFNLETSLDYVRHILIGLKEHSLPEEYFQYVLEHVIKNNSRLRPNLPRWNQLSSWCSEAV